MFNILYLHYSETGKVIKSVEILLCWGLERCYVAVINVGYQSTVIFSSSLCKKCISISFYVWLEFYIVLQERVFSEGLGLRLQPCFIFSLKLQNRQGLRP